MFNIDCYINTDCLFKLSKLLSKLLSKFNFYTNNLLIF